MYDFGLDTRDTNLIAGNAPTGGFGVPPRGGISCDQIALVLIPKMAAYFSEVHPQVQIADPGKRRGVRCHRYPLIGRTVPATHDHRTAVPLPAVPRCACPAVYHALRRDLPRSGRVTPREGKLNNSTGAGAGGTCGGTQRAPSRKSLGCSHPCARAYTLAVTVRVRARPHFCWGFRVRDVRAFLTFTLLPAAHGCIVVGRIGC